MGTGAFLFALARVAPWAVPVWWLPRVHGAIWLAAVLLAVLSKADLSVKGMFMKLARSAMPLARLCTG